MTRDEASKRLDRCSKNLGIGVNRSEWMTHRCQLHTFLSYVDFAVAIDLVEVERTLTDEMLTNLIKERIKYKLRTVLDKLED
jgi:hypothetical protein